MGDDPGTWITPSMKSAYLELHRQGLAHSVECHRDGKLVGGLYGVSIGRMFSANQCSIDRPTRQKSLWRICVDCWRQSVIP